jgi:Domain of unknown function (DUF4190)
MTAHGGDHGEQFRDQAAPFPAPDQSRADQPQPGQPQPWQPQPWEPQPWQQYPHPPVDPGAPVNYPEYQPPPYPPIQPPQPPPVPLYSYPPPYGGPVGYGGPGGPPAYFGGAYDPYQAYPAGPGQPNPYQTNGLAVASLVTSIVGVFLGIPLAIFCFLGLLIPIAGAVLGAVSLNQIKRTHQQGRGLAIAGIAVGTATAGLLLLIMIGLTATAMHSPYIEQ